MHRPTLLLASLAIGAPLALAQTATAPHRTPSAAGTAHHTTTAHTAPTQATGPACATLPPISPKIPALPASVGCPKVFFTVSDRLDYLAPVAERYKTTIFADLPVVISLDYADIAVGTGELAKQQQYYTVKYTGWLTDGTKFDSSEDHAETKNGFTFPYGAHRVIAGWDLGFEGMRVGGKRRLYVPYQFGYGAQGKPPDIPAKSMLIFDMELVAQSSTPPAPPTPPTAPPTPATPGGNAPATPSAPGTPTTPAPSPGDQPPPPKPGSTPPASAPSTPGTPGQPS